ncbi:MAG: hypothetical protein ACYTBJ_23370, partial [Planctomycetota bacterium]
MKRRKHTHISIPPVTLIITALTIAACSTASNNTDNSRQSGAAGLQSPSPAPLTDVSANTAAAPASKTTSLSLHVPTSTEPLLITSDRVHIACDWAVPITRPASPDIKAWVHRQRKERPHTLAGRRGRVTEDTFATLGLELVRQVWMARSKDAVAIRQRIRNRGAEPIRLDALVPLQCTGPNSLMVAEAGPDDWDVLSQKRFKDGLPTVVRLDAKQAEGYASPIESDPFCLVHPRNKDDAPSVLAGHISQLGHCARLLLKLKAEGGRTQLDYFSAECEFDGIVLPAGGERSSQWLLLRASTDPHELIADFADRMGRHHNVNQPPKTAPTVPCSWYYYYRDFG